MARPLTEQDKAEIWDLVMAGGTHGRVGKQVGRSTSVVQNLISSTGGVSPVTRCRAAWQLNECEREDIAGIDAVKSSSGCAAASRGAVVAGCRWRCLPDVAALRFQ